MPRTCSIAGCTRPHAARGYCRPHWKRWQRHGAATAGGAERKRQAATCSMLGCAKPTHALGLCDAHYALRCRNGDPTVRYRAPRGTGSVDPTTGYRRVGHKYEHREVWIRYHGPIPAGFDVHHKNEDKLDNRIENLELLTKQAHTALHQAKQRRRATA